MSAWWLMVIIPVVGVLWIWLWAEFKIWQARHVPLQGRSWAISKRIFIPLLYVAGMIVLYAIEYLYTGYVSADIVSYNDRQIIYADSIKRLDRFAFIVPVPPGAKTGEPDTSHSPKQSQLQLTEDGRPLGPSHTSHSEISEIGMGRYSHFSNVKTVLIFSTSDNSDPRTNGRTYRITEHNISR